ncbi:MAG TPA: XdhC family protein [Burkholderiales bacterium]|jgi:xanthine dehydrogenase accessory factor
MRSDLLKLASDLTARGERFALVTVVRREPPSSAHVGDTALVTAAGDVHGWVGGGCTRSTLLREALRALAEGEPRLLSLSPDPARERRPGLVPLPMTCKSGGTVDLYVEPVLPVPHLVLFGTSAAIRMLARIGHAMGYRVDVVDPDAEPAVFPEAERVLPEIAPGAVPQGAYVLVATLGERDVEAIQAALALAPAYVGAIASRTRFAQLRDALLARGVAREVLDRIAAPAGLDIGAKTPEEVALSVMAQIVEQRRRARTASAPEKVAPTPAPAAAEALEAVDPICGMTVAIAGARHYADVEGRRYYFCCGGCRTRFLADPARYASSAAGAAAP